MPKGKRSRNTKRKLSKRKKQGTSTRNKLEGEKSSLVTLSKSGFHTPSKLSSSKKSVIPSTKDGQAVKGRREVTRYRDAKGRFFTEQEYTALKELVKRGVNVGKEKITKEKGYIDPFGRGLPNKKPKSLGGQIGKAGHNLCYPVERKALFARVQADLLAAKKAEKDEFKKDRLKIYFQLTDKRYGLQSFDRSSFKRFLLLGDDYNNRQLEDFWTTDSKTGVCTKRKKIFIAYDKRDRTGRITGAGKPIKQYQLKVNKATERVAL